MAKCPWCNEWEGPPEKYSDHLKYCKKYPLNIEAMKEQAQVRPERPTQEAMTICERVAYYRYIVHLSVPEIAEKLRVPELTVIMCIRKILALDVKLIHSPNPEKTIRRLSSETVEWVREESKWRCPIASEEIDKYEREVRERKKLLKKAEEEWARERRVKIIELLVKHCPEALLEQ